MYKSFLTNPISGKIIEKTNIKMISLITQNYFFKLDLNKHKKRPILFKRKANITDEEYFKKYYNY